MSSPMATPSHFQLVLVATLDALVEHRHRTLRGSLFTEGRVFIQEKSVKEGWEEERGGGRGGQCQGRYFFAMPNIQTDLQFA